MKTNTVALWYMQGLVPGNPLPLQIPKSTDSQVSYIKWHGVWTKPMDIFPSFCIFKIISAAAAAKSLQSCLTLCDPIDSSPSGFPIPGILQARTLEWVAISFSNAWKWKVKVKSLSQVLPLVTPWTATYQAPLSIGFSRQEYWSGVPLPSPIINH